MIPWTATREDWINMAIRISSPLRGLFWKKTYRKMEWMDGRYCVRGLWVTCTYHTLLLCVLTCAIPRKIASMKRIGAFTEFGASASDPLRSSGSHAIVPLIFFSKLGIFDESLCFSSAMSSFLLVKYTWNTLRARLRISACPSGTSVFPFKVKGATSTSSSVPESRETRRMDARRSVFRRRWMAPPSKRRAVWVAPDSYALC